MNPVKAMNTYTSVGIESGVASADPHKLILMLYQGALLAIASAKNQILRHEIAAKGSSITKAIKIIDEGLKACLDVKAGGEIAKNLHDLYDYMNQRLLIANLKNDIGMLDEVSNLLGELRGAWESIRPASSMPTILNEILPVTQAAPAQPKQDLAPPSAAGKKAALLYGRM